MAAHSSAGEQVYATLLMTDEYTAGALVLGRSLKDAGTCKKLAVLVTLDSVSQDAIAKLRTVYDHVIPVARIQNDSPANLHLMARADLHSAFTKIQLWKLTQFSRIVYLDADVVAYRAPDELFNIPHIFGAAPDIGWPDIFNSGVMVLTPSLGDFRALAAMTERGISFDGADQGLLNQYFGGNYHRLSFSYNVTPSAHYQYLPAYRHFQSSIRMVHFIGKNKPWFAGRQASFGNSAYDEMVGRWWAVYDRHYFGQDASTIAHSTDQSWAAAIPGFKASSSSSGLVGPGGGAGSSPNGHGYGHGHAPPPIFPWEQRQPKPARKFLSEARPLKAAPAPSARAAGGTGGGGGGAAAAGAGGGSRSASAQQSRVEPPREAPQTPTSESRHEKQPPPSLSPPIAPSVSEMETVDTQSEAVTPTTPSRSSQSNPWTAYPRLNAWDDVPGINRYVEGFERLHRMSSSKPSPDAADPQDHGQTRGTRVTDFPTESERPSLPVTPAPVRRAASWTQDDGSEAGADAVARSLPVAEGVPNQSEWDPTEQLQKLAAQQSEALLRKLGGLEGRWPDDTASPSSPPPLLPSSTAADDDGAVDAPQLLSPRPVKAAVTVRTASLEGYADRPTTWYEDEGGAAEQ